MRVIVSVVRPSSAWWSSSPSSVAALYAGIRLTPMYLEYMAVVARTGADRQGKSPASRQPSALRSSLDPSLDHRGHQEH